MTFWDQTPATHGAIMEGSRRRRHDEAELAMWQAWQGQRFARERRLQPFAKYARELKPRQAPRDMLATLRAFQAAGANMTIRRVEHGE